MKQIIVRKMTLSDYFMNSFYKIRFWYYKNFNKNAFRDRSEPMKKQKNLVFKDNFNYVSWGTNEDGKKWTVGGNSPYHPENLGQYYGPGRIVNIKGKKYGEMIVRYNPKTFPAGQYPNETGEDITIPFETTRLSSINSFRQQYGRFECRCTIPHDEYVWPAFWMWGSTWPPEIDVFEFYGGRKGKTAGKQEINLHYGKTSDKSKEMMGAWTINIEKKKPRGLKFHEFACEWSKNKIEFFTDGIKVFRYTRKDVLDKWFNDKIAEMWVDINHAIEQGSEYHLKRDFESSFLVDYIRVYKNK